MIKTQISEQTGIQESAAKRNLVFDQFVKNPADTHLALEIKLIDDKIARSRVRQ